MYHKTCIVQCFTQVLVLIVLIISFFLEQPKSPTEPSNKEVEKKEEDSNPRKAYEQFLNSTRADQRTDQTTEKESCPEQQQPLFQKVEPKEEIAGSEVSSDLQVEDLSVDEA